MLLGPAQAGRRRAGLLAALLLASCATPPGPSSAPPPSEAPLLPAGPPGAAPSPPSTTPPPAPSTLHDILTSAGPVPAGGMERLARGEVRRDRTSSEGDRTVRQEVFRLRLGVDEYMVLRRSVLEGGKERPFLYALFKVEDTTVTLQRAWRDEEGEGTFRPAPLERGIRPLLGIPPGFSPLPPKEPGLRKPRSGTPPT